jgi:hypothetical protein
MIIKAPEDWILNNIQAGARGASWSTPKPYGALSIRSVIDLTFLFP